MFFYYLLFSILYHIDIKINFSYLRLAIHIINIVIIIEHLHNVVAVI